MQKVELHTKPRNLSKDGFRSTDDVQIRRHNLREVRDALGAKTLEDERDRLHNSPVMLRQRRVSDVAHEDRDGDCWVEVFQ